MDATMSSNNNYRLWNYPNQSGAQGTSTQGFFASKPKPTPKSQLPNQNESWEREQQQHQNSAAFQTGYGGKSSQLYQHQVHQQQQRNFPSKRAHDITLSPSTPKTSMASSSSSYSPPKHNVPKISRLGLGHAQVQQPNKPKVKFFNKNNPNNSFKKTPKPEQDVTAKNQVRYSNLVANDKEKEWTSLFQQTIERINFCPDGGIVNTLLYYLQPPRASRNAMKAQITNQMQNLMSPLGVKDISVFGSTLTELDFIGSDLDYHVQLQVPPSNNESVIKILNQVAHLSRTRSYDFRVIYMIQHARIPIIRLLHLQTKTTCDVNFTSKFGYFNSCFIGHLLSYDFRIKELAVILKLWSKSYKIADKMILSNYCLVMLLIFYLQNLDVPMLDTIKNNQASRSPMIIDPKLRWNVFFSDKINRSHENNQTTRELLIGFFEFYHKLNFGNYIVSMYNGDLIPRNLFDGHPDFETYRQVVAQCELLPLKFDNPQMLIVQDGFEQNLNVGIKCKKHVDSFTEMIKLSYLKCTELKNETFSQLTIKLLTGITIPVNLDKSGYKAKKKSSMTIYSIAGDLKLCQDILSVTNKDKIQSVEDQQEFFFNHVYEGTKMFLNEVYLCFVTPVDGNPQTPMRKVLKVVLHVDTVNGRKKMQFKDNASYEDEIKHSKIMMEQKKRIEIDMTMTISSKDKGKSVEIFMIDNELQVKSSLLGFCNYFSVNLPLALKYYLKKQCEDITKDQELS